jgi:hypothetical protein
VVDFFDFVKTRKVVATCSAPHKRKGPRRDGNKKITHVRDKTSHNAIRDKGLDRCMIRVIIARLCFVLF